MVLPCVFMGERLSEEDRLADWSKELRVTRGNEGTGSLCGFERKFHGGQVFVCNAGVLGAINPSYTENAPSENPLPLTKERSKGTNIAGYLQLSPRCNRIRWMFEALEKLGEREQSANCRRTERERLFKKAKRRWCSLTYVEQRSWIVRGLVGLESVERWPRRRLAGRGGVAVLPGGSAAAD